MAYPGGMIGGVPLFNEANRQHVSRMSELQSYAIAMGESEAMNEVDPSQPERSSENLRELAERFFEEDYPEFFRLPDDAKHNLREAFAASYRTAYRERQAGSEPTA